ncbi:FecR family protein [Flavivirga sp. 57AJ16]|uniref:FecR family protein n=1 Tax=Flavivirga sp. 57AJ16 TaxID=3025307 RepID=UPI002365AAC1|nr:FecR domain-containing protein [Flavivirga sp. 57AJ16]MDD7888225.1 FecR domain-containing protein [Flavivirga sp. 57AJ16]
MSKDIENLIVKFLLKEASFDELQQLELWINNPKNETMFSEYIKTNASINNVMNQYDKNKAKENIIKRIRQEKKSVSLYKRPWFKYAAAAVLVIALASTYFLRDQIFGNQIEQTTPIIVNNQIEPGTEKATLTLETGEIVALEKGTTYQTQNAVSNGGQITYNDNTSLELVYNYLTIPRGGQFQMTLSDGTKVWLNSESQLKYPVSFADGKSRQVELVYGEAYFDVSPSTEHNGSDFKVFNNNQEVKVLGTEFNIKAYKGETNIYTTLVEGKVNVTAMSSRGSEVRATKDLVPGQQATLNINNNQLAISNVNVNREIAWINGEFMLEHKTLKEIMKVLSRWYDMDVTFANEELGEIRFVGVLGKDQTIVEILNTIKIFGVINDYEINNKQVLLK